MTVRQLLVVAGALAVIVLAASCGGSADAFEELEELAGVRRDKATLVFVYTDG